MTTGGFGSGPSCRMNRVTRLAIGRRAAVAAALTGLLLAAGTLRADHHRIMVGESIYVGPDDVLDQVTCISCSIHVEGVVRDSAFLVLGRLENRGKIGGDAFVVGGSLESSGEIGGDSVVVAGHIDLRGTVGGNATSVLGNIRFASPDASVQGDVATVMGRLVGVSPDAVNGKIEQVGGDRVGQVVLSGLIVVMLMTGFLVLGTLTALNLVAYLILGTERVRTIASALQGNVAFCFLGGLVSCFAMFVIGMIVAMLLPVSLPIMLVFLAVSVVGYCGVTFWVGRNLFASWSPLGATVGASLLLVVLQLIPVVGWLVMFVLWNIAIGAAVLSGFGTSRDWLSARADGQTWGRSPVG